MNTRLQVQTKTTPTPSFMPVRTNLLPHPSPEPAEPPLVPPMILHEALPTFQAKLTIGQPNDQYEQEADRVADQVMRMPDPKVQRVYPECEEELQRQPMEEDEEEEETLQTKPLAEQITPLVQRQAEPMEEEEEEETLQSKTSLGQLPTAVSSSLQNRITALKGDGQPLPQSERAFFEPRFGSDFSQVRVHADSQAAETANAVNARAFTLGRDIVFGQGQYLPGTNSGRRLLAHELAHTIQQTATEGTYGTQIIRRQCSAGDIRRTNALAEAARVASLPWVGSALCAARLLMNNWIHNSSFFRQGTGTMTGVPVCAFRENFNIDYRNPYFGRRVQAVERHLREHV